MDNKLKLTIVYKVCEEGGYTSYIKEMRGVISEGETIEEARANVLDALGLMLESDREDSINFDSSDNFATDELLILS
ncbi:MAG: type II toxin-antitoxin system HicB family antitoxin [Candidatus Kapabacteria bacterium]|nr:type II toxin-antitoxin system HicB family antitoxin [Candidatus Kapabacteria bacterium]